VWRPGGWYRCPFLISGGGLVGIASSGLTFTDRVRIWPASPPPAFDLTGDSSGSKSKSFCIPTPPGNCVCRLALTSSWQVSWFAVWPGAGKRVIRWDSVPIFGRFSVPKEPCNVYLKLFKPADVRSGILLQEVVHSQRWSIAVDEMIHYR
jgi:hypothetical protein